MAKRFEDCLCCEGHGGWREAGTGGYPEFVLCPSCGGDGVVEAEPVERGCPFDEDLENQGDCDDIGGANNG